MASNTVSGRFFGGTALAVSTSSAQPLPANTAYNSFTVHVDTTGTPTSYSVKLQGLLDPGGSVWTDIGAAITADGTYNVAAAAGIYYSIVRANITAVSGGTSPTIFMPFTAVS